jgi:hypothetical protein
MERTGVASDTPMAKPKKKRAPLTHTIRISPDTKALLDSDADNLQEKVGGKINRGKLVDQIVRDHYARKNRK